MKGSTIWLIAVTALVLLIGGGIAYVFGSAEGGFGLNGSYGSTRSISTLSNVKMLGIALMMYETDYDGLLPPQMNDGRRLKTVLYPYVKNNSVFETYNPNGGTIEPNENLSIAPYDEIVDPPVTVMLFDTLDWPEGGRNVGYADSHAKFVNGFDRANDTEVVFTPVGVQIMAELAEQREAAATAGPPPTNPLGMPGN